MTAYFSLSTYEHNFYSILWPHVSTCDSATTLNGYAIWCQTWVLFFFLMLVVIFFKSFISESGCTLSVFPEITCQVLICCDTALKYISVKRDKTQRVCEGSSSHEMMLQSPDFNMTAQWSEPSGKLWVSDIVLVHLKLLRLLFHQEQHSGILKVILYLADWVLISICCSLTHNLLGEINEFTVPLSWIMESQRMSFLHKLW